MIDPPDGVWKRRKKRENVEQGKIEQFKEAVAQCNSIVFFGGAGVWMDKGFEVQHVDIPIRQETIEICEFFNINPYLLDATGCLFVVVEDGEKLVEYLTEQEMEAAVIGVVTEKKEKLIVVNELEHRCLSPVNGDEIHKVL